MISLETTAERNALKAEPLAAFSGIKLMHIKNSIAELLRQIGSQGIFEQYTRHDITHIDSMLQSLEWLIPDVSKAELKAADWLLLVLAIYFHDLGLLVTKDEFEKRGQTGFRDFCDRVLFAGEDGIDYRDKVDRLSTDDRERFLYQDFVRAKHAERIKHWITGKPNDNLGIATTVANEIDTLFRDIDPVLRRDLGLICESHHLDDLGDLRKYKTRQPYGCGPEETSNLQYCAILLRTADLLHITRDRTPSVAFRILNPSDPISQEEWAKQMAVRAVRPQLGLDKDGNLSISAPQDTIEIHAFFQAQDGFFGLTSYLKYAEKQLRKSNGWVEAARQSDGIKVIFPWKHIDVSNIETDGFLNEPFEFTLDQAKILDLLTGHTLYNETSVVVRELVQNALDATRLQCLADGSLLAETGMITLHWASKNRVLTVQDNGTGMSQAIIENHLLKVGSSRYQDPEFIKQYPSFHPISRFGIGVLSCFMIADKVEITTCHPDDPEARQLTLKSVHGRYLVRLLDKKRDEDARTLGSHGTRIRLTLRASAALEDPVGIAKKWIVIPGCRATIQVDDTPPIAIGYDSVTQALEKTIEEQGFSIECEGGSQKDGAIRIKEYNDDATGLSLAIAVRWSGVFTEWEFLQWNEEDSGTKPLLGLCVEGVRVQFTSPGFKAANVYAIANATGKNAPKTNVARSNLEESDEVYNTIKGIYALYMRHISDELAALRNERKFSITWSVQEATFLVLPFLNSAGLTNSHYARQAIGAVPLLLVESGNKREATSLDELNTHEDFWTIDGKFYESAEDLLREVPTSVSLRSLIESLRTPSLELPSGVILCQHPWYNEIVVFAFKGREPRRIRMNHAQRRLDIQWGKTGRAANWRKIVPKSVRSEREFRESSAFHQNSHIFSGSIARNDITVEGVAGEIGVRANGEWWIFANTPVSKILNCLADRFAGLRRPQETRFLLGLAQQLNRAIQYTQSLPGVTRSIGQLYEEFPVEAAGFMPRDEVLMAFGDADFRFFDPSMWVRGKDEDEIPF